MFSAHIARAGVIGLGRVGVVRRTYRSSMKILKMRHGISFFFKDYSKESFELFLHQQTAVDDMPTLDHAALHLLVSSGYYFACRFFFFFFFFSFEENRKLLFVVKGKCTTVILKTLLTLYIVHMLRFFYLFCTQAFLICWKSVFYL